MESLGVDGLPRRQLIVGVSANSDADTEKQALASGVDVFIAKPFTATAFTKVISDYYSSSRI
jgi:response regulator of citrate/malate metabolism